MMKRWNLLVLILAVGATGSFAEEAEDDADEEEAVPKTCVNRRNINSFDAIDDEHVYIRVGVSDYYLFTMQRRCFGLRNAMGIGIKDTMSRVCSGGFGEIVYREMGRVQSCRIKTIESVASREDAEGLVKDRKQLKEEEKANN